MNQSTPALRVIPFPDGSAHVGMPDGWTATTLANGTAILTGPDGAGAALGCGMSLLDPRGTVAEMMAMSGFPGAGAVTQLQCAGDPARVLVDVGRAVSSRSGQPDPQIQVDSVQPLPTAPGWVGAALSGTQTTNGIRVRFQAWLTFVEPQADGMWSVLISMVTSPVATFDRDLPTLLAIANSIGSGAASAPAAQAQPHPALAPRPPSAAPAASANQTIAAQEAKDVSDFAQAESDLAEKSEQSMEKSVDAWDAAEFGN